MTDLLLKIDDIVWGIPLIVLIMTCGIWLTARTGLLQVFHLGKALKFMVKNEEGGTGEVTSFGALCTALSATIGTGNIVGVAYAISAGGPGALFWMEVAAFFGMATKYAEGLLAVKYRQIDKDGHVLGGPFYYIEKGMGKSWKWLAKCFAFTTILGWDYYAERSLEYLTGGNMKAVKIYRWMYIIAVFAGPYMTAKTVWTIADIFNGLMAIPNIIALLVLSGVVAKETRDYFAKNK